jgi:hypothetical protein
VQVLLLNLEFKQLYLEHGMKKLVLLDLCGIYCEIHEVPLKLKSELAFWQMSAAI